MTDRRGRRPPTGKTSSPGPPDFKLRPATQDNFNFAKTLYMASMQPLLAALGAWKEEQANTRFRSYFKPEEIWMITVAGADIGWIQISDGDGALNLDQLHLTKPMRNQGIGTKLIKRMQKEARRKRRPLRLSFIRGNRAGALYERLGFRQVGGNPTKIHMQWDGD